MLAYSVDWVYFGVNIVICSYNWAHLSVICNNLTGYWGLGWSFTVIFTNKYAYAASSGREEHNIVVYLLPLYARTLRGTVFEEQITDGSVLCC